MLRTYPSRVSRALLSLLLLASVLLPVGVRTAWAQSWATAYDSSTTPIAITSGQFTDVHGGVWSVSGGVATGAPDSGQYFHDFLARLADTARTNERTTITLPASFGPAEVGAAVRYQSGDSSCYFAEYATGSNGIAIYAINSGSLVALNSVTLGTAYNASHVYKLQLSATGTSPTTVVATVVDVTAGNTTLGSATATDSTSVLQAAGYCGVTTWGGGNGRVSAILNEYQVAGPTLRQLICIGDSITYGVIVGGGQNSPNYPQALGTLLGSGWLVLTEGFPGRDLDWIFNYNPVPGASNAIQTGGYTYTGGDTSPRPTILALPSSSYIETDAILCEITNSAFHASSAFNPPVAATGQTAQDIYVRLKQAITDLKGAGYAKVYIATTISTLSSVASYETLVQASNALVRANWSAMGADGLIDFGADPRFYGQASCANPILRQSDGVHPTVPGDAALAGDAYSLLSTYGTSYAATTWPVQFAAGSSSTTVSLSSGDIANIATSLATDLQTAGAIVTKTQLVNGPLSIDASGSGSSDSFGDVVSHIGDTGSVDLVIRAGSAILPLDGWTATGSTTTLSGTAVSTNVACTIVYGAGGVVRYPRQVPDTATAGRFQLKIKLVGPGGQQRTVGPITEIVSP